MPKKESKTPVPTAPPAPPAHIYGVMLIEDAVGEPIPTDITFQNGDYIVDSETEFGRQVIAGIPETPYDGVSPELIATARTSLDTMRRTDPKAIGFLYTSVCYYTLCTEGQAVRHPYNPESKSEKVSYELTEG